MDNFVEKKGLILKGLSKLSGRELSTASPNFKKNSDVSNKNEKDCAELCNKFSTSIGVEIQKSVQSLSYGTFIASITTTSIARSSFLHDYMAVDIQSLVLKFDSAKTTGFGKKINKNLKTCAHK